jgi:hypothetical protein
MHACSDEDFLRGHTQAAAERKALLHDSVCVCVCVCVRMHEHVLVRAVGLLDHILRVTQRSMFA